MSLPVVPPSPLHPDLLALLASCRSAPADDTPRLVLADWLEEHADVSGLPAADDAHDRAALIRVQVELARPTCDAGHVAQLRATERQLIATHAERWLGDLPRRFYELRNSVFGFAEHSNGRAPFVFEPFRPTNAWRFARGLLTVELYESELSDPELGAWFASPLAAWVELAGVTIGTVAALVNRFTVPDALRPYLGVRYVAGAQAIPTMRFGPAQTEEITTRRIQQLLKAKNFALVRDLTVYAPAIRAGFLRLMTGADVTGVRRLNVKGPIDDSDAASLASSRLLTLSALDVSGTELSANGMFFLANAPHLKQLVSLTAYRNRFGDAGLISIVESPLANTLNVLELQNTGIGDRGVAALVRSPLLTRLNGPGLNLSMNPITGDGATALASCEHLARFTELILRDCRVTDAGAKALAESPHAANLTYLDLWKNAITDKGARALAESPYLEGLRHLSIHDNAIGEPGAKRLRARFDERVRV